MVEGKLGCTHINCTPVLQATTHVKPDICGALRMASLHDPKAQDPLGSANRHALHLHLAKGGKRKRSQVPNLTEFL